MTASELRFKNVVESPYGTSLIYGFNEHSVEVTIVNAEDTVFDFDLDELMPIFLTEEWFIKFGFKKIENNLELHFRKGMFNWYSSSKCIVLEFENGVKNYDFDIECEYVHQLQNIFFFTAAEELEINL